MDYIEYKKIRESLGTQAVIAKELDISVMTLSRRELGKIHLSREAKVALLSLTGKSFKLKPSGKVAEPKKDTPKKEPENIKKSPAIQDSPYTEPDY